MIKFTQKGDFSRTFDFLKKAKEQQFLRILEKYGKEGVNALSSATPVDTGLTASSWYYKIERNGNLATLSFCNSNIQNEIPIAIILQYGHGTGTGGWVEGRDYINPAIQPVFNKIAKQAWEEITKI